MARALLIIDFQNDFTPGGALAVADGDTIAPKLNALAGSGDYDLVIATRDWHPADHGSFEAQGGIWPVHCVAGTQGAQLHPDLDQTKVDIVVDKGQAVDTDGYSGFDGTDLEELLRERDITQVTVVGLATDYCVKNTALDALKAGFQVTVDSSAARGVEVEPGRFRGRPGRGARGRRRHRMKRFGPDRLIEQLRAHVSDERVLEAMRSVPRDLFVPAELAGEAWDNVPLPIGAGQTISQPLVVARMLEQLELQGGERILDIGTGSGYHAALLGHLGSHVWSVERHRDLSDQARRNLETAEIYNVTLIVGDGARGLPDTAPFDAINVAAAAGEKIPQALVDQLGRGGRLIAPVQTGDQRLWLVHHTPGGRFERTGLERVRFVPLVT